MNGIQQERRVMIHQGYQTLQKSIGPYKEIEIEKAREREGEGGR